ncbi:MAG: CoA-binding protein [Syntrophotaleaceae bacterium]
MPTCLPKYPACPSSPPPQITEQVVEQAIARGINNIWMQPGAESSAAIARCEQAGINLIADGSCLLVVLGYHEAWMAQTPSDSLVRKFSPHRYRQEQLPR